MKTSARSNRRTARPRKSLALAVLAVLCGNSALGASVASSGSEAFATVAHTIRLARGDAVTGALPMMQPIHIEVALKMRDREGLDAFIADNARKQAARVAPQLMTSAQFLASHAPTQAQAQTVANYLGNMGYTNIVIAPNRLLVSADGTAATARNAFMTTFAQVRTHDGRIAFANTDAVRIPAALQDKILAVVGLQTVHEARAVALSTEPGSAHTLTLQGHYPTEFPSIYGLGVVTFSGSPSIGVVTQGNVSPVLTDLDIFAMTTSRSVAYSVVYTNGTSSDTSHVAAWDLSTQSAAGMANPNSTATLILYDVPSLSSANLTADYNRVVSANATKIIEASISECETDAQADGSAAAQDAIFKAAIAQGQTFVFPAGDSGADECSNGGQTPSWPASSQYVIAVGGTSLNADRSQWFGETAWSMTGGSRSTFEAIPAWQTAFGLPGTTRAVPDIAFDADPASGALIVVNRTLTQMGGTGLSAALFAAVWDSVLGAYGTTSGFAGPVLYKLPIRDFHDIIAGSNGRSAHSGWDYTSGRGSMLFANTLADSAGLVNQPPSANFTISATAPLSAKFTDTSTDDGTIVAHFWDFGDGKFSGAANPSRTYATAGIYQVTETVTDNYGATNQQTQPFVAGTVELLSNTGFETGTFKGWSMFSRFAGDMVVISDPNFVFAGTHSARMEPKWGNVLAQDFTLPAYKTSASLTFHLRVDDSGSRFSDTVTVQLSNGVTLATFTTLDASSVYVTHTYDLTPYLGQGLRLKFTGGTGYWGGTNFYIDDVTVTVQ